MNAKLKSLLGMLLVAATVTALLTFVQGCQKEEPSAQPSSSQNQPEAEAMASAAEETATEAVETVAETLDQTTCPVMGGPINKAIYVEHEGKKVYFCCKGCETQFQENPEKYVKLLPQFQN